MAYIICFHRSTLDRGGAQNLPDWAWKTWEGRLERDFEEIRDDENSNPSGQSCSKVFPQEEQSQKKEAPIQPLRCYDQRWSKSNFSCFSSMRLRMWYSASANPHFTAAFPDLHLGWLPNLQATATEAASVLSSKKSNEIQEHITHLNDSNNSVMFSHFLYSASILLCWNKHNYTCTLYHGINFCDLTINSLLE